MPALLTAALGVAAGLGAVSAAAAAWGRLRSGGPWSEPFRDMIIVAAHPDDDVILAGEYGIEAAAGGRWVRVVYVTSGAARGDVARADLRQAEATASWALAGVPAGNLTFLGAASTDDMEQPIARDPGELEAIREALTRLLVEASPGTVVFIPASGESHVEHRLVRAWFLDAWRRCGRGDLDVLEGPEYNRYQSLVQCPARCLHRVWGQLPGVQRVWKASDSHLPGFTAGGPGQMLPARAQRLELKRRMLRCFAAQNPDLLVRAFGHPDRFRKLASPEAAARGTRLERLYLTIGGEHFGPSALVLVAALAGGAFAAGTGAVAALFQLTAIWPAFPRGGAFAAVTGVAAVLCLLVRRTAPFRNVWIAAGLLGLAIELARLVTAG